MAKMSNSLVKQFAKTITQSVPQEKSKSSNALGTLVKEGDIFYAMLDGSTFLTPVSMSMSGEEGDRVLVTIQNHSAIVTSNITAPGATTKYVERVEADLTTFKDVTVKNLLANYIRTDELEAKVGTFGYLKVETAEATYLKTVELEAKVGTFGYLKSEQLESEVAKFGYLKTGELAADVAKLGYLKVTDAEATYLKVDELEGKVGTFGYLKVSELEGAVGKFGYLTADQASLKYAQIDFANVTGQVVGTSMIKDGAITDAKILGLSANKITAGILDAAKITVTNLNADNITVGTLNGKLIGTGSVDLNKLAEEVPTKEYLDSVQNGLQDQIDKSIQTYTVTAIPLLNNEPAQGWATEEYQKHVGDICYVVNPGGQADGYTYRFEKDGDTYGWSLIKDSQVTEALQKLMNVDGDLSGLKSFQSETSSWITKTDSELSSVKSRTTTIETTYSTKEEAKNLAEDAKNGAIDEAAKDATSKANQAKTDAINTAASDATSKANSAKSEAISAAASDATSKANSALDNAKKYADDAKKDLENALSTKVESTTFNEVKQTVDTNSAQITQMTKTLEQKADGSAVESLQQTVNTVQQTANENASKISQVTQSVEKAQSTADDAKAYTDAVQNQKGYRYKTDIVVYGDRTDYYYPVYLAYGDQDVSREIVISRGLGEHAPDDWHTPTHKGGLILRIKANYGAWGGAEYKCEILDLNQIYCTMVGDVRVYKLEGYGICIWLRGGGTTGAIYHIYSDQPIEYRADQASWHTTIPIIAYEPQKQIGWIGGSESNPEYTWISDNPLTTPDENHLDSLQALKTANIAKERTETISQTVNEVKQTADSNSAQITQMNQTIAQKADGSKVTELEERTSSVEQNLSGFKSEVSSTYTTKTEFENLEIGGRNLFLKTGVEHSNNDYRTADYDIANEALVPGKIYTATICVTPGSGVEYYKLYFSAGYVDAATFDVKGTSKQTVSTTFIMPKYYSDRTPENNIAYAAAQLYRYPTNGTVTENSTIHWIKIEKGTKATDWIPAPEDLVDKSTYNSYVQQTDSKIAAKLESSTFNSFQNGEYSNFKKSTNEFIGTSEAWEMRWNKIFNSDNAAEDTYQSYITFQNGEQILGNSKSNIKLHLKNDIIQFEDSNGNALASFDAANIYLGKNNTSAIIDLCNGTGKISNVPPASGYRGLTIEGTDMTSINSRYDVYLSTMAETDTETYGSSIELSTTDTPWYGDTAHGGTINLRSQGSNHVGSIVLSDGEIMLTVQDDANIAFLQILNTENRVTLAGNQIHLAGKTYPEQGIFLPSNGTWWVGGKTATNCIVACQQTAASYHPAFRINSAGGHVWNIGGINNEIGFYGFKASRADNDNGVDFYTRWDMNNWDLIHSGYFEAQGLINTKFEYRSWRGGRDWRFGSQTGTGDDNQFGFYDGTYGFHGSIVGSDHSLRMIGSIYAGYSGNTGAERQVGAIAGAGTIYMYSQANAGGNMGIYAAGRCAVMTLQGDNWVCFEQPVRFIGGVRICGNRGHDSQATMSSGGNWVCMNRAGNDGTYHGNLGSSTNYWNGVYYKSLNKVSDKRKKRNLGMLNLDETLILLKNTKTVKYSMLDDSEDMIQYGVFAQDVRDMLIVNNMGYRTMLNISRMDGSEQITTNLYESEDDVTYSVDYLQFIAPLIKGWQYHNDELSTLKKEYQSLQGQYQSLQGQIEALRDKLHELEMAM